MSASNPVNEKARASELLTEAESPSLLLSSDVEDTGVIAPLNAPGDAALLTGGS